MGKKSDPDGTISSWSSGLHIKEGGKWRRMRKAEVTAMNVPRAEPEGSIVPMRMTAQAPGTGSPMKDLIGAGVTRLDNGDLQISSGALQQLRSERLRRVTIQGVPSTPRHVMRDGGGLGVGKGYNQLYQITHEALRSIRERGAIFQTIHAARRYQVQRLCTLSDGSEGSVGFRVVHKDHTDPDAKPPDGFERYVERFKRIIQRPLPSYDFNTMSSMMVPLIEDLLTINRPCVEVMHSLLDPELVVGFHPVDGAMIWPTLVWMEKWKTENPRWSGRFQAKDLTEQHQLELASKQMNLDLFSGKHVVVREGILEAVLPPRKMIVAPMRKRTDINLMGYWPSHVEEALELGVAFINSWNYNSNYFTRGMLAEFALGISGDVHDDDVDAFVDMFREATQGVDRAWQPPVIPLPSDGDIKKIDLKSPNKDMGFEIFMSLQVALASAVYRMDPSTINAKPWDAGASGALSAPNRHLEIALAKEEGLRGDVQHLTDEVLNPLARRCHPDLRVVWDWGDVNPKDKAEVFEIRGKTDLTRNDIRLQQGRRPKGFWMSDEDIEALREESPEDEKVGRYDANLWNMPTDPGFVNSAMQQQQMAQMDSDDGGFDDGGGGGGGNDYDGDDDGFDDDSWMDQAAEMSAPDDEDESPPPRGEKMQKAVRRRRSPDGRVTVTVYNLE